MGSSQKRKKEKKKDFQKPKLKVGKARPQASNFTDTSFKAKSIVLNQQSLSTTAPSATAQFSHSLSLLNSKSDTQRKEALANLATAISSRPVNSPLPQPVSVILPSLVPLVLDGSNGVRTQLVKLLKVLPAADIEGHASFLLPYIRAGMTHLAADIRLSAIDILSWLLSVTGQEVVACAGGWIKTLNCFLSILGWHTEESAKWSSNRASFGKAGSDGKPMARVLQAFADFLRVGLCALDNEAQDAAGSDFYGAAFPLRQTLQHLLPMSSSPYAYLDLFGRPKDEEGEMYESREDRLRVFTQKFQPAVLRGIDAAKKDGGEVGRVSASVSKALKESRHSRGSLMLTLTADFSPSLGSFSFARISKTLQVKDYAIEKGIWTTIPRTKIRMDRGVSSVGMPHDHHAIFIETNSPSIGCGYVYQVTGSIQNGMVYEDKAATSPPEDDPSFVGKSLVSIVKKTSHPDKVRRVCRSVEAPKKQFDRPRKLYPEDKVRHCQEWTAEAVAALTQAGLLNQEKTTSA
ncbi:rRNA processing protein [Ophidiomyces ophidiicola]|nr:rRNA processing protein [Ophidiomyces ophidiicola]